MSSFVSRVRALSLAALVLLVPGCLDVEPPDGVLQCGSIADCPDETWQCRDNGAGAMRCYRGEGSDAGPTDTSTMDVPADTSGLDASPDVPGDAGMPDTRPACVDPAVDCPAEETCSTYACVAGECMVQDRDCDDGITCTEDRCVMAGDVGCVNTAGGPLSCGVGQICAPDAADADPTTGCAAAPECTVPAGCNDGDACTVDDCVEGSCTFTPMTCPSDTDLCTEVSLCVAGSCTPQSPISCADDANMCTGAGVCSPGTGLCAYPPITCTPDASACTGPVSCVPSTGCMEPFNTGSLTNVDACGTSASMCVAPCPTRAGATRTCVAGACGYTCTTGFVDLDMTAANGCEYACTLMTPTDAPDLGAVDANCDGADGDIAGGRVIYVSPSGSGDGTRPGMAASLAMGFTILNGSSGRNLMLLQAGSYSISTPLSTTRSGFELWGGYSADYRTRTGTTTVTSTAPTALAIRDVSSGSIVGVDFVTTTRTVLGESSHTVDVVNSTGVRFSMLSITAGAGARGSDGSTGMMGIPGTSGQNGFPATTTTSPGMGGGSGAGRGGNGGAAPNNGSPGTAGDTTFCASGAMGGGAGTVGTQVGSCIVGTATDGGPGGGGGTGCTGTVGSAGAAGTGDGSVSMLSGVPTWSGPIAGTGMVGATGGRGGGGGGGGGISCPGSGAAAGGGGSGGAGASGGRGGSGGGAGGASIGILVFDSMITLDGVSIALGLGGQGGRGGDGGGGGSGGLGGGGGAGATAFSGSTGGTGGMGGAGGRGGTGGRGGCGGGGVGGVMAGVFRNPASPVPSEPGGGLTVTGGGASPGGPACFAGGGTVGDSGRTYRVTP